MATFTLPDRVVTDHGETPRDSGMPIGGHSQHECLMRELGEVYADNRRLRKALGDLKVQLDKKDQRIAELTGKVIDQRWTADRLADVIQKQNGTFDQNVSDAKRERNQADFDLLATRTPG